MPGIKDPNMIMARYEEVDGCHLWTGAISNLGYGRLSHQRKMWYAHRFFWHHQVGTIPPGRVLDHLCGNRRCVNIEHLECVWHEENTRRGRPSTISTAELAQPLTLFP